MIDQEQLSELIADCGFDDQLQALIDRCDKAEDERDELKIISEDQRKLIESMNSIIGGDGSRTTENITCIARLENERDALKARINGGIRVMYWYDDKGEGCFGIADASANATLIHDEDVEGI